MAKLTGGGFTNLPADRTTLVQKLARSDASFSRTEESQTDDLYVFVLEDPKAGIIRGTCQVFGQVGVRQPFYSYHLSTLTQTSPELGKTFRNQTLTLTTDLEGSSEVGGLFLHPGARAGGWGALIARSRYLFIKQHRARFGDRILAELRGVMDEAGNSPFWDGLAGRFFDMTFPEADEFNAVHGTQFIADLMPKTPIYVSLLSEQARAVMGLPHPSGRAALQDAGGRGFHLRPLSRHFRRRSDGHRAYRRPPHGRRIRRRRDRRDRGGREDENAPGARPPQGIRGLLRADEARRPHGPLHRPFGRRTARREGRRHGPRREALMALREINFDGIIGPSHNYAGLSFGNLASTRNAGQVSQPRAAALQGLDKMRANLALGLAQGIFVPLSRPNREWLGALGTTFEECEPTLAAAAMSASAMWAANAATVSPAPDTKDGLTHLTVANLRTMPHRSHEWPGTLAQLRIAFAQRGSISRFTTRCLRPSATRARPITCG